MLLVGVAYNVRHVREIHVSEPHFVLGSVHASTLAVQFLNLGRELTVVLHVHGLEVHSGGVHTTKRYIRSRTRFGLAAPHVRQQMRETSVSQDCVVDFMSFHCVQTNVQLQTPILRVQNVRDRVVDFFAHGARVLPNSSLRTVHGFTNTFPDLRTCTDVLDGFDVDERYTRTGYYGNRSTRDVENVIERLMYNFLGIAVSIHDGNVHVVRRSPFFLGSRCSTFARTVCAFSAG